MNLAGRVKNIIPIFESRQLYTLDILPDVPSHETNAKCAEFLRLLKVDVDEDRVMNRTPRQALATLQSFQGNTLDSFRDDTESFVQWNMFLKLAVELMKVHTRGTCHVIVTNRVKHCRCDLQFC